MPTHIIVGGGASGILACYELLQHGHDVILLEAGSETYQTSSDCYLAQNWGRSFNAGNVEVYQYLTTPQPCLNHRQIEYPQGAGLGGSTNINAMIWSEGYPAVYDRHWPKSWSAQFVGKLMTYVFDVVRPDITDSRGCMQQILNMVYRKKEAKTGGSFDDLDNPDFAIKSVMPSYFTMTTFQPPKLSSCKMDGNLKGDHVYRKQLAHVLLDVPEDKKKDIGTLTVIGNAEARRVVFRDRKAVSVEYYCKKSDRIKTCEVGVAGEIILCAGAFGTPRILLSTGLGEVPEKASTSSAGDDNGANVTISDIGRNLQDHVILPFFFLGNWKAFRDQCESTGGAMGSAKNSMKQRLKRAANLKMKDAMDRNRMYPGNSVHGWIHLDSEGEIYDEINSSDVPRCVCDNISACYL
jgi:choline dehydrogenase-like flavoprotein